MNPENQKRRRIDKLEAAIEKLIYTLNPIPFVPTTTVDIVTHKDILIDYNLYEFSKIEFDTKSIQPELIAQLVINYDAKKHCSYVNGHKIKVSRTELARALKLPVDIKKVDEEDYPVLDWNVVPKCEFIYSFVSCWMILHGEKYAWKGEICDLVCCIVDGHPEFFDAAGLIWCMVERELTQREELVDCYYAAHLQCLISSQYDCESKEKGDAEV